MEINEAIEKQILALLNITDPPVDLKPITDRLDALEEKPPVDLKPVTDRLAVLESKPSVPNLSLEVATLEQSTKILGQRISALPIADIQKSMTALGQSVNNLLVESVNPPDDSNWRAWLHREIVNGKIALTYYVRSLVDQAAIGIWSDPNYADYVVVPSHANAVAISDTEFRQNLIQGLSLVYAPKRDAISGQIGIRLFTSAGTFTSVTATALDSAGALLQWSRSLTDFTGEANMVTPLTQAAKIRLTFVKPDQTSVVYEFPIS